MSMLVLLFSFSRATAPTPVLYSQQLLVVGSVTLPALAIPAWEKSASGAARGEASPKALGSVQSPGRRHGLVRGPQA